MHITVAVGTDSCDRPVVRKVETEITDAIVIEVLLALIRYPGSQLAEVVRRLQGHSPPIRAEHVRVVFDRFDLEHLGEKGETPRR